MGTPGSLSQFVRLMQGPKAFCPGFCDGAWSLPSRDAGLMIGGQHMITVIYNGEIYAPEPLGVTSILVINQTIVKIGDANEEALRNLGIEYEVVDANGSVVVPGFIDPHVH